MGGFTGQGDEARPTGRVHTARLRERAPRDRRAAFRSAIYLCAFLFSSSKRSPDDLPSEREKKRERENPVGFSDFVRRPTLAWFAKSPLDVGKMAESIFRNSINFDTFATSNCDSTQLFYAWWFFPSIRYKVSNSFSILRIYFYIELYISIIELMKILMANPRLQM